MMLPLLLLLPAVLSPTVAWIPVVEWESGNVTTSVGESGQCVCHVFLPDITFPADRVENMQEVSKDLLLQVENQMNKVVSFEGKLEDYLKTLRDLAERVDHPQTDGDGYIKLDFELLRIELREFEALVTQLKQSLNSSSPMIDSLYTEIHNMTLIVNQLEIYDKRNLELIRIEFARLQEKLEECQKEQEDNTPDIGNCDHKGILSISTPRVIQFNADVSSAYVYGGWGKDSKPAPGYESMYFYGGNNNPSTYYFNLYSDYKSLILRSSFKRFTLSYDKGNNFIVHGHTLYYQRTSPSFSMGKMNLTDSKHNYRVIVDASERFSYSYYTDQSLDFAGDEKGLWVIYASEDSQGKLMLAKIDENLFDIDERWSTNVFKVHASNAFMACGVLYVTRSVDLVTDEIFYAFDTETNEEKHLSIRFQKFQDQYSYLDYNPTDQKLYMYNKGYYVSYNVRFGKE